MPIPFHGVLAPIDILRPGRVMTKDELILHVVNRLPDPDNIDRLDSEREPDAIRFHYKDVNYRVGTNLFVEEIRTPFLISSKNADKLQKILRS